MINSFKGRAEAAKQGAETHLSNLDGALAYVGAQKNIGRIQIGVNARAGEISKVWREASALSTEQLEIKAIESKREPFYTDESGDRIMPESMWQGLQQRIKKEFDKVVKRQSTTKAIGITEIKLRSEDLQSSVISNDTKITLLEMLTNFACELNEGRSGKIAIACIDGNDITVLKGVREGTQIPLELPRN